MAEFSVFTTVFIYSIFILLAPIATFFSVKVFVFDGLLGTSSVTGNVWSAVFAVIVLHIALGLFVYRAYFEKETVVKPGSKEDKID